MLSKSISPYSADVLSFMPQSQNILRFSLFCARNNHLWATCCFLFLGRFACVGPPFSGDFTRQAENCQTIGFDESARYHTNERCTSIFIVILFFAFFYIAKLGFLYRQSCHATTRAKVQSTVPAMFVYQSTSHIFCIENPANYVGKSLQSEPKPGLPHRCS